MIQRHKRARLASSSRIGKSGIVRIQRDNYSNSKTSWFEICAKVRARDNNRCVQCSSATGLEVHHIRPLTKGGRTIMSNLITLCKNCHKSRHSHIR